MTHLSDTCVQSPKSPKSPESEKSKRYDRQLRLWGECGQQALESSHVCLINATSCGTEILKSLVLPGIRAFTIIDPNLVTEEDIGNNFFLLQDDSIGKSRAKIAAQLLLQMNDDVKKGDHLEESFESLIDSNANFFTNFSLVIATGINNEKSLIKLSQVLWETNVPLIVCKTIGFIGYIRLQVKEHTIVESHPDNSFEDLRLDQPFDALKQYLDSYESFDEMSRKELSHTPYLVVLFKFLNKWRTHFNRGPNDMPKTFKEKNELISLIRNEIKQLRDSFRNSDNEELKELDLENFEEAIKAVNTVLISSNYIPPKTQLILNDPKVSCNQSTNSSFWLSVKALKQFVSQNNSLPLIGTIPDMTSDSAKYIQLQKIYRLKAKEDAETVHNILQNVPKVGNMNVTENEINIFCKNSHNLRIVRTTPIDLELTGDRLRRIVSTIQIADDDTEHDELRYYILMRLIDRFYSFHNRFPGQCNDEVESDVSILKTYFKEVTSDLGCSSLVKDDLIHEICRYGGCELHTISAFIGGCAAQEVIKIVTKQYVPIDNTFVYNGITSVSKIYRL